MDRRSRTIERWNRGSHTVMLSRGKRFKSFGEKGDVVCQAWTWKGEKCWMGYQTPKGENPICLVNNKCLQRVISFLKLFQYISYIHTLSVCGIKFRSILITSCFCCLQWVSTKWIICLYKWRKRIVSIWLFLCLCVSRCLQLVSNQIDFIWFLQ